MAHIRKYLNISHANVAKELNHKCEQDDKQVCNMWPVLRVNFCDQLVKHKLERTQ